MSKNTYSSSAVLSQLAWRLKDCFTIPFKKNIWMAYCGLFIGMYIVLYYCNISLTATLQFRLGFLALALSGMIGGPLMGITVGALGDILSMIVTGGFGQTFFFGFTLSYSLMGLLFGLIFYKKNVTLIRALLGALAEFVISLFLTTEWLNILYYDNKQYLVTLYTRLFKCSIMFIIVTISLFVILKAVQMALKKANLVTHQL